jgi:hypothetical protein
MASRAVAERALTRASPSSSISLARSSGPAAGLTRSRRDGVSPQGRPASPRAPPASSHRPPAGPGTRTSSAYTPKPSPPTILPPCPSRGVPVSPPSPAPRGAGRQLSPCRDRRASPRRRPTRPPRRPRPSPYVARTSGACSWCSGCSGISGKSAYRRRAASWRCECPCWSRRSSG